MSSDVTFTFGGDISGLQAALDEIKQRLAQSVEASGEDADASMQAANQKIEAEQQVAQARDASARQQRSLTSQLATEDQTAADARIQRWEKALKPVDHAFATSIQGMIMGTQTWQQAEKQVLNAIVSAFVQGAEDMLTHWMATKLEAIDLDNLFSLSAGRNAATRAATEDASQTAQTAATVAGGQERVAAEASASGEGLLIKAGNALKSIAIDAYEAAAGAYAAVASIPYVGPFLAPVMAAGALAAVFAFGNSIFSAEGGMDRVPFDGAMFQLHKDEMVLPASIATPLRAMTSFGLPSGLGPFKTSGLASGETPLVGGNTHVHVSPSFQITSPDAAGVRRMLLDNHGAVAEAMLTAHRNGHSAAMKLKGAA